MNRSQRRMRATSPSSISARVLIALEQEFRARVRARVDDRSAQVIAEELRDYARRAMHLDMTHALRIWDLADAIAAPAPAPTKAVEPS